MKVYAKSDNLKQNPRFRWHPKGMVFDSNGMADWPDDGFTRRRLRDGDISLGEEPKKIGPNDPMPDSVIGRRQRREEQKALAAPKREAPRRRPDEPPKPQTPTS